jgi:(p)ppGpp synthase/HD superfamily hydrolase
MDGARVAVWSNPRRLNQRGVQNDQVHSHRWIQIRSSVRGCGRRLTGHDFGMTTAASIISTADAIAESAHAGQVSKYTGAPYVRHPRAVAALVMTVAHTPAMIAAALLHDVLEDTAVTEDELRAAVGDEVTGLVKELTDQVPPSAGNRALRKQLEAERLAATSAQAQTIKMGDLIDNVKSIAAHDRGFARVYLREKDALIALLTKADPALRERARQEADKARGLLAAPMTARE